MSGVSRSMAAFLRLKVDSVLATRLVNQGLTLTRLKSMSDEELSAHGVDVVARAAIRGDGRPPIPVQILEKLLETTGGRCVVCGESDIIVHHIVEWEVSRSHDLDNLVVLCLQHHGEAHSTHELSKNLTPDLLRSLRSTHIAKIHKVRVEAALNGNPLLSSAGQHAYWDFFHFQRLIGLAGALASRGALLSEDLLGFWELQELGILSEQFSLNIPEYCRTAPYIYYPKPEFEHPMNQLLDAVLRRVLTTYTWIDLTPDAHWTRGFIRRHVATNSVVVLKARLCFRSKQTFDVGPDQTRKVYHRRRGVELHFQIDGWMALSNSAYSLHLTGSHELTAVCVVREVSNAQGILRMRCTCLAIGTGFGPTLASRKPKIAYMKEASNSCDDYWPGEDCEDEDFEEDQDYEAGEDEREFEGPPEPSADDL